MPLLIVSPPVPSAPHGGVHIAGEATVSPRIFEWREVMANFKRQKTKRNVRCTLCTPTKWMGNTKGRFDHKTEDAKVRDPREGWDD